ncbi:MAG: Ig-like domain-containing protein [Myxococcaceae bacterium]
MAPDQVTLGLGGRQDLVATATFSDGTKQDVTASLEWSTSDENVATIDHDATGRVTVVAKGGGSTGIVARSGELRGLATVTVSTSSLQSIEVAPQDITLPRNGTRQLSAIGHFGDGTQSDLTAQVNWVTSNGSIVTVNGAGLATAQGIGTVVVNAQLQGKTGTTHITVLDKDLKSLSITPSNATVSPGQDQLFNAVGQFSDGSSSDLTSTATWSSSAPNVASIAGNRAHGVAQGTSVITAAVGLITATAKITVSPPTLTRIEISPVDPTIARSTSLQLVATGLFSDGSAMDVTAAATWASADTSIVTVAGGLVKGMAGGSAKVTATFNGVIGGTQVTVTTATLTSIELSPPSATLAVNTNFQLTAFGHFSDGSTQDITASASWTSSAGSIASCSGGLVLGLSGGTATITASMGGQQAAALITVTQATLVSIEVDPQAPTAGLASQVQFSAVGLFSDGSTQVITNQAAWSSSSPMVASVSDVMPTKGQAKTLTAGSTTITATVAGVVGKTTLTVTAATLTSIAVSPASATIGIGGTQQLHATGTYSDGSTQDVTAVATWSSNAMAASVSNGAGSQGLVKGNAGGSAVITATLSGISGTASITVTAATLTSIAVTPAMATSPIGAKLPYTAIATYSDGSMVNVTTSALWSSSQAMVASVSNGAGTQGIASTFSAGMTIITATFGGLSGTAQLSVQQATLVSITVTPQNPTVSVGGSVQFHATGLFSDGSQSDVTTLAVWASSSPSTATVSNGPGSQGLAKGVAQGSTNIVATIGMITGATALQVNAATLVSITVTPSAATIGLNTTQQYTATGLYSDNSLRDITTQVSWSSSKPMVATISAAGLATGASGGSTTITASLSGLSGSASLTVSNATLVSLVVQPTNATMSPGGTLQLRAMAGYSDGSIQDVSAQAMWGSSNAMVVGVNATGFATAFSAGSANVTANFGGFMGLSQITVQMVTLQSITVTPANAQVGIGSTQQFTATGLFSDGSMQNITASVTWATGSTSVATITSGGKATGVAVGNTTVTATQGGISGSANLSVTNAALVSIEVSPQGPTIAKGTSLQLTATGVYSDGSFSDLTASATWSSSRTMVATVSSGLTTGVTAGQSTITATVNGISGNSAVTVTAAVLTMIDVSPQGLTLPAGLSQRYTAAGLFSDGSTQDLSTQCMWSSSRTTTATVSNSAGSQGQVTTVSAGTTNISCTYGGQSGVALLTVGSAVLTRIDINPPMPSVAKGSTLQLRAVGTYTDGTITEVTSSCAWASATTTVATVDNGTRKGLATGVAVGSSTVSCQVGSISGSTVLTVSAATLLRIEITPIAPSLSLGTNAQLTATGIYSDGTTGDLTALVTWSSSAVGVATISNAATSHGQAHSIAVGTTTITATLGATTGSTPLQVTNAALQYIDVQPYYPYLELGQHAQFHATGYYSDNSTQDITTQVLWSSDTPSVAPISNAPGSQGVVSGLSLGQANITCTFQGQQGWGYVIVNNGTLTSIAVQPTIPSAAKGTRVQFTAWGIYSDGNAADISNQVVWNSSDTTVATIQNGAPSPGLANAVGIGTTSIEATLTGIGGSTTLTVGAPTLSTIAVTPANSTVPQAGILQMTATATYSDGSTQDVTTQVIWSSSMPSIAGVSNASGSQGLAKGIVLGTTTVTATFGTVSGSTPLTVSNVILQYIDVEPYYGSIAPGTAEQLSATGYYSDGSTAVLTHLVTWTSTTPTIATVDANGLVTAVSMGQTQINATYSGVMGQSWLTVQAPISIAVTPTNSSVRVNATLGFTAMAIFNDGSQEDVTDYAIWTSSVPSVATVSNASGSRGLAKGVSQGMSSIKATMSGVGGSTTLTVTP